MERNSKNRNLSKDLADILVRLCEVGTGWSDDALYDKDENYVVDLGFLIETLKDALNLTGFGPGGPDELDMLEATHAEV